MSQTIRVAILDDHQAIIDGYCYRLERDRKIQVVAKSTFGDDLEPMLASHAVDVLFLDINVPTSADNDNPYPILHLIPKLLQKYPDLQILVISMYNEAALIRNVMEAGASGYIIKDDRETIQELAAVTRTIARGGIHMSRPAYDQYFKRIRVEDSLSSRQLEAISLCASYPEKTTSEIADIMGVANSTVRNFLSEAYMRLEVPNRMAAIAKARRLGLLTPDVPGYHDI
ncbi:MAG: response regulator transcription factor [Anaerolineales bacterium]|nr:response regulator transcription factor [Chloroflexota bacterium]MBL6980183.1 response regulator transcription factor [Anaerolineales bacterium]